MVAKVILVNSNHEIAMAKVKRGFFTGHWTLPGGFVDYAEHPVEGAVREVKEELGLKVNIDPNDIVQIAERIFKRGDTSPIIHLQVQSRRGSYFQSKG